MQFSKRNISILLKKIMTHPIDMKMHPCPSLCSNKHLIIYENFQIMYYQIQDAEQRL
jgi:hypothetical protein